MYVFICIYTHKYNSQRLVPHFGFTADLKHDCSEFPPSSSSENISEIGESISCIEPGEGVGAGVVGSGGAGRSLGSRHDGGSVVRQHTCVCVCVCVREREREREGEE